MRTCFEHEIRTEARESGLPLIVGYAVKWGARSLPVWRDKRSGLLVFEQFERGAFAEVLVSQDVDTIAVRDHSRAQLLGRYPVPGTLQLLEDDIGLRYTIDPPDTSLGRETVVLLERRDLRGASFKFAVAANGARSERLDNYILRTVTKVIALDDVTLTARPAYPDSVAALASENRAIQEVLDQMEHGPDLDREHRARSLALAEALDNSVIS